MINNKEKKFISAVVYIHDNETIIEKFLMTINRVLNDYFEKYEIICVNDCSSDNSVAKIEQVAKSFDDMVCTIVNMSYYQGSEVSMNAGIDLAIGDFVFEFDHVFVDYDESLIIETYNHLLEGYDIVSTSNRKEKKSSKLFYKLYNMSSHSQYKLCTETFRILSRRAINRVHSMSKSIPYRKALYANCGLKMDVLYYTSTTDVQKQVSKELSRN
ncbi:MAG: glycosyltransferase, partial [Anaerorhabdus sp.]